MDDEKCVGCLCEIKRGLSKRRKLYSPSTCHVLPAMTRMFRELYSIEDVEKLLPSVESDRSKENIFVCVKCFRSLEKLLKIEDEKKELETSLKAGFMNVGLCAELQPKGKVTPTRTRKRSLEKSPPAAPTPKKRRGPDTPTRNVIQRIHAPGTPSVSVS